jgi:hypothetical protein
MCIQGENKKKKKKKKKNLGENDKKFLFKLTLNALFYGLLVVT